jgi:hypothetical protein
MLGSSGEEKPIKMMEEKNVRCQNPISNHKNETRKKKENRKVQNANHSQLGVWKK